MEASFTNLVFSGGGTWGIAYLGVLEYLFKNELMENVSRVAGTSAGAITACITSFNLPFEEIKTITNSLDYSKVPGQDEVFTTRFMSASLKRQLNKVFGNIDCVYRLVKQYGWYSSSYFYEWLKTQIALHFDATKKLPPYTFTDFRNSSIHKDGRPFLDLYVIGTDVSLQTSRIFSYDSTPNMEVAEAVRISMSFPIFFEAIKSTVGMAENSKSPLVFSDGGLLYNYPINLFDKIYAPKQTLGCMFISEVPPNPVENLLDFIKNVISSLTSLQMKHFKEDPSCMERSIPILTGDTNSLNFNIKVGDETYNFLYKAGFNAAEKYFTRGTEECANSSAEQIDSPLLSQEISSPVNNKTQNL